jgi:hypothetical protein
MPQTGVPPSGHQHEHDLDDDDDWDDLAQRT